MSEVKLKHAAKFKTYGRNELGQKRTGEEFLNSTPQKTECNDYVNEIFAGLMWLG